MARSRVQGATAAQVRTIMAGATAVLAPSLIHSLLTRRIREGASTGDIKTPEQYQPRDWMMVDGKPVVWEACQTLTGSWGYDHDNLDWKSTDMLVRMLIDTVSKGSNLLLNVGPTGRGEFHAKAIDRLRSIGEWMRLHR